MNTQEASLDKQQRMLEEQLADRRRQIEEELERRRADIDKECIFLQGEIEGLKNRFSYSQKERKRLEEVVREQDEEIKILLEGGSGFRRIKELMGGLTNTVDQLQSEADESARGVVIVRNILSNIDEIFKNRAKNETVVKKKRTKKGDGEEDDHVCEPSRVIVGGGRAGAADHRDKNSSALNLGGSEAGDGIREKDFKDRNDYLIAKNGVFMTAEELELFKDKFIQELKDKERRKKLKNKQEGCQTKLSMARDPFMSLMRNLEDPPPLDTGRLRKVKEKKEVPVSLPVVAIPPKPVVVEEPKEKPVVTRKFTVKNVVRNLPDQVILRLIEIAMNEMIV